MGLISTPDSKYFGVFCLFFYFFFLYPAIPPSFDTHDAPVREKIKGNMEIGNDITV